MQSPSRGADRSKYCVVGGGIIGSWTALQLRRAGVPVVLFEQFPLPHTRGSSHGGTIFVSWLPLTLTEPSVAGFRVEGHPTPW